MNPIEGLKVTLAHYATLGVTADVHTVICTVVTRTGEREGEEVNSFCLVTMATFYW